MAHINLPEGLPGIRGQMAYRPEIAKPLNELAEVLLRSENSLSRGERELIATYVSSLNDCFFCQNVHGAIAQHYLECDMTTLDNIKKNYESAKLSDKIKSLLGIAGSVQESGKKVTEDQIKKAKALGATDMEIHDTVLIAAAFCMFNRYVDGLGTWAPLDREIYVKRGAEEGYANFDLHSSPYTLPEEK